MIATFADEETRKVYGRESSRRFGPLARIILRKLLEIDAAVALETLRSLPGNCLEALRGDRAGQYSIRVNQQYRICFEWRDGDAYEVEVVGYH